MNLKLTELRRTEMSWQ